MTETEDSTWIDGVEESKKNREVQSAYGMMSFDIERGKDVRRLFSYHLLESDFADEQNQAVVDELSHELDDTDSYIIQNELDEYIRMRESIVEVEDRTPVEVIHAKLWRKRHYGDTLARWGLSSGQTDEVDSRSVSSIDDDDVPSLLGESQSNITETGQIQLDVEKGQLRVSDMGNDYNSDNRLFRLTCRLLQVYGWDDSKAWFEKHWQTDKPSIVSQMRKVSNQYEHLPGPPGTFEF